MVYLGMGTIHSTFLQVQQTLPCTSSINLLSGRLPCPLAFRLLEPTLARNNRIMQSQVREVPEQEDVVLEYNARNLIPRGVLHFKRLDSAAFAPVKGSEGSAGIDILSPHDWVCFNPSYIFL